MPPSARRKSGELELENVEFREADMRAADLPDEPFDVAACAFGIFFSDDMEAQLSRIVAAVRPGGRIAITGFQENLFHSLADVFFRRLERYGVKEPDQGWKRIATGDRCR